ncbi:hypothetical protein [Micrococcoides hystricis]|uniref:ABC-type glycine betaine transport system substrate-binding domain-containing protein n=1 Tax=Micrococcoides hystricis TaxID=1572761 RepID=A0ABV6P9Z8_9MICC
MAQRRASRSQLLRAGALVALAGTVVLSGCTQNPEPGPTPEEITELSVFVPAEPLDAAVTEAYLQYVDAQERFKVDRQDSQGTDQQDEAPAFFNESEVKDTLTRLVQGNTSLAVVRAGQALNMLDPNTLLVPVTRQETSPAPEATPSPWPSTAAQKDEQLADRLPITIQPARSSEGRRGVRVLSASFVKTARELEPEQQLSDVCDELDAVVQNRMPIAQIRAELAAGFDCEPQTLTETEPVAALREGMSGTADLVLLDSANPAGFDKGMATVLPDDYLLRADNYRPLLSTSALSDTELTALSETVAHVSEKLTGEELTNLYRYIHEDPSMTPAEAATWWLHRQGLLTEEN